MLHVLVPLVLAVPLAAQPSLLRLDAVADVSADADQPSVNFGAAPLVTCGKTFTSTPAFRVWLTRGYFRFDLSSLAGMPLPDRARLRVYQEQASAAGCLEQTVHRVTQPWTEATVTWNNKPAVDSVPVATQCVGDSFDLGFKNFDVTTLVRAWMQATVPNYGLVIRDPSESLAGAARPLHATSREGNDPRRHPQLEVAWGTVPFGTGCGPNSRVPALDLESGSPARGDTYVLLGSPFASGAGIAHVLGTSNTTWNGNALPINLGFLGYPPCNVYVAPELFLGTVADHRGRTQLAVPVPNVNFLRGRTFYHQVLAIDGNLALAATNGFGARVF